MTASGQPALKAISGMSQLLPIRLSRLHTKTGVKSPYSDVAVTWF